MTGPRAGVTSRSSRGRAHAQKGRDHRLQELVRLHRLSSGKRDVARPPGMSPNTERQYRLALEGAGLLAGATQLPELEVLKAAVRAVIPSKLPPQQTSSLES